MEAGCLQHLLQRVSLSLPIITLDQDNLGNLLLHREGDYKVWLVSGRSGAWFYEDALLLSTGLPRHWDWSVTALPHTTATYDGYERIVIWRGPNDWDVVAQPNKAALEYLGLPEDKVHEHLVRRPDGRPPIYMEARQRLNVEVSRSLINDLDALARQQGISRTALIEQILMEGVLARRRTTSEVMIMNREEAMKLHDEAVRRLPDYPRYWGITNVQSEEHYNERPTFRFDLKMREPALQVPIRSREDLDQAMPPRR